MSCFGCDRKYGLFCKEYGCPNCGYSYCAKCLKRPAPVVRHQNKIMKVCLICYDKLSKTPTQEEIFQIDALPDTTVTKSPKPISNRIKTVNSDINCILKIEPTEVLIDGVLEPNAPSKLSKTTHDSMKNNCCEISDNLDSVITKRLISLKATDQLPTDDQLRSRFENLSGLPNKDYFKRDLLLDVDQRNNREKTNDLLTQFMREVQLDKHLETERNEAISDIEKRLKALRDTPIDYNTNVELNKIVSCHTDTPSDNEDDETLKHFMYLKESCLSNAPTVVEDEWNADMPKPLERKTDIENLPWCNICNENAVYRCKRCEGELFCAQCFCECHNDDEEYRIHVKETYTAPSKLKEDYF